MLQHVDLCPHTRIKKISNVIHTILSSHVECVVLMSINALKSVKINEFYDF